MNTVSNFYFHPDTSELRKFYIRDNLYTYYKMEQYFLFTNEDYYDIFLHTTKEEFYNNLEERCSELVSPLAFRFYFEFVKSIKCDQFTIADLLLILFNKTERILKEMFEEHVGLSESMKKEI